MSLYCLLGLGLVFSSLSMFSHSRFMTIDFVEVEGEERATTAVIEAIAWRNLAGNFLAFFSKSNILLYDRGAIQKQVLALPQIQSVEVARVGLHGVSISIEERKEDARWCEGDIGETGRCFSVDENGLVFDSISDSTAFIYRGLIHGPVILGQSILTSEEFKKTQFFMRELGRLGLVPMEAKLSDDRYMTTALLGGGSLIINSRDDLSSVLSNITAIISDKTVAPSVARFLETLDYMKLDSGNKVVYKMK